MKISINIEADNPQELHNALAGLMGSINPDASAGAQEAEQSGKKNRSGKKDTTNPAPAPAPEQPAAPPQQPAGFPGLPQQPQQQVPAGWPMTQQQFNSAQQAAANVLSGQFPQQAPATAMPGAAPAYSHEQLALAAGPLVMSGRQPELQAMLQQFGVGQLQDIPVARLGEVAQYLRALGAQI